MIRNKTHLFIGSKQRIRGNKFQKRQQYIDYPIWIEDVYKHKDTLKQICNNNNIIDRLVNEYKINPSVYLLQQVQKNITTNCKLINEVDYWLTHFRSQQNTKASQESIKNVKKHLQLLGSEEIKRIFANKQKISMINNQLDHNRSFSRSFSRVQIPQQGSQRQRIFNEVNFKIQNLNTILRRMNTVVQQQGQLINRIDENLNEGQQRMKDGKNQIKQRADRQRGIVQRQVIGQDGQQSIIQQLTCEGKINKAITSLYLINIVLIIIFLIKNTFF